MIQSSKISLSVWGIGITVIAFLSVLLLWKPEREKVLFGRDSIQYLTTARAYTEGIKVFRDPHISAAPLFPWLMEKTHRITGQKPEFCGLAINLVAYVLFTVLIGWIGFRLFQSVIAGWCGAVLASVNPLWIRCCVQLQREALYLFLYTLSLYAAVCFFERSAHKQKGAWGALICGSLAWVLAINTRHAGLELIVVPVICAIGAVRFLQIKPKFALKLAGLYYTCSLFFLLILPVVLQISAALYWAPLLGRFGIQIG